MNNDQFYRAIASVGMTCFVEYYELFDSKMKRVDVVEHLKTNTSYTEKACNSRTSHARRIIKAGRAKEALKLIASSQSSRISESIRDKAEELLRGL